MTRITDDFKGELKTYLQQRRKKNDEKVRVNPDKDWILVYDQAAQSRNYKNLEKSLHQNQSQGAGFQGYQSFLKTVGGVLGLGASQQSSPDHRQSSLPSS